ncbi:hypothetical protein ACIOD0_31635 [Kitasatospora albolonga]
MRRGAGVLSSVAAPEPGPEALVVGEIGVYAFHGDEPPVRGRPQQDPAHTALAEHGNGPEPACM